MLQARPTLGVCFLSKRTFNKIVFCQVNPGSASCAEMATTNPTMKGAATPVTVGLDQAPQPHLTRLPIVSASASPTLSDHCTISWPPLTACSHLTRTYAATLGTGVFGARRNPHCSVQSLAQRFKTEVDGLQSHLYASRDDKILHFV